MTRVSTAAFYERSFLQLGGLRKKAESLQSQIGTGQRLSKSSEDPVAAARLRELSRKVRLTEVDQINSDSTSTDLKIADGALSTLTDIVVRAKELALQGSSESLSDQDRGLLRSEIETLRDGLLALANSRDAAGHALFGGETAGQAYTVSGTTVTYSGTATSPETDLGDGQKVVRGVTGPEIFEFDDGGNATDLFAVLGALSAGLAAGGSTALAAARDSLSGLDAGLDKLTTAQTIIGGRLGWIETVAERRTASAEQVSDEQARVGGADLAATISRLQETMTVLEASQASFVRLSNLQLFDILR